MSEQGPEGTPVQRFVELYKRYVFSKALPKNKQIPYQQVWDAFNQLTEEEQFRVRESYEQQVGHPFEL